MSFNPLQGQEAKLFFPHIIRKRGLRLFLFFIILMITIFLYGFFIGQFSTINTSFTTIQSNVPVRFSTVFIGREENNHLRLVPEGHAVNVDDVEELFVEIHIVWRSNPLRIGTPGILSFDLIEIKNQDGVDVSHIIFIETNNIEIKSDNLVTFKSRVWMNEPEDQANYDLVAGKKIIVTGSYKVQPNFS